MTNSPSFPCVAPDQAWKRPRKGLSQSNSCSCESAYSPCCISLAVTLLVWPRGWPASSPASPTSRAYRPCVGVHPEPFHTVATRVFAPFEGMPLAPSPASYWWTRISSLRDTGDPPPGGAGLPFCTPMTSTPGSSPKVPTLLTSHLSGIPCSHVR